MRKIIILVLMLTLMTTVLSACTGNTELKEEQGEVVTTEAEKEHQTAESEEPIIQKPTFVISDIETKAGEENVLVSVTAINNPGISSVGMSITYSDQLTLNGIAYNEALGGETAQPQELKSPIKLVWVNAFDEFKDDGVIATLSFNISQEATGELPLTIYYNYDDVYDSTETNVDFDVINGSVVIVE